MISRRGFVGGFLFISAFFVLRCRKFIGIKFSGIMAGSFLLALLFLAPGASAASYSASFDGVGQYAYSSDPTVDVFRDTTGTMEMWVKLNSLPTGGNQVYLLGDRVTYAYGGPGNYTLMVRGGDTAVCPHQNVFVIQYWDGEGVNVCGTTSITVGTWYHVAIVRDGPSSKKLYVNSILEGNDTSYHPMNDKITSAGIGIGAMDIGANGTHGYSNAFIDDIKIWSTARSATQISDDMKSKALGSDNSLLVYYKFDNNWNDSTANGYNLTSVNFPSFSTDTPQFNLPPTLSYSTDFSNGIATSTMFLPNQPAFKIDYSDANNDPATGVFVVINGVRHQMQTDGSLTNWTTGVTYSYSVPTGTLKFGTYDYHFEASDGSSQIIFGQGQFKILHEPVILIPGILGSELKKGNELLWLDLPRTVMDVFGDTFLDSLQMKTDGSSASDISVSDVLREKDGFHYFDKLISDLSAKGYQENTDLFVFPYDWRLDNKINSELLGSKINKITDVSNSQVNIVAHSMGGLVVKQYILDHPSAKIDHLIFIGTPHLGAPKAAKILNFGDDMGIKLAGVSFLDPAEVQKISQDMPGVYQLLPGNEYFNQAGSYLTNGFEKLTYNGTTGFLASIWGVNGDLLLKANKFHNLLDTMSFAGSQVKTYNLAGCKSATITNIIKSNIGGIYGLRLGSGDHTVPLASSDPNNLGAADFYITNASHSEMPSQNNVVEMVDNILADRVDVSNLPDSVTTDKNQCGIWGKMVTINSPVALNIYNNSGHVGPTSSGSVEYGIPGVTYDMLGHNKFTFLPEDKNQQYTIKLDAYATGTFSLTVATIENDQITKTVHYTDVSISPVSKGQMVISLSSADDKLEFARDGGTFTSIPASSVLDKVGSQDLTPPVTSATISGVQGNNGWYRSSTKVTLAMSDELSGILRTEYSLDNGSSWNIYNGQFVINQEGTSTIKYKSVDRAGNEEDEKQTVIRLDLTPPEATIVFVPSKQDISIVGTDNLSAVSVNDQGNKVVLADEAGNTTTLNFVEKDRRKSLRTELSSILYNGIELNAINKNRFLFQWGFDKKNNLNQLVQTIKVKNDFSLNAEYRPNQNLTVVSGKDVDVGKIKEKLPGLVLFKIQTNKGGLDYKY